MTTVAVHPARRSSSSSKRETAMPSAARGASTPSSNWAPTWSRVIPLFHGAKNCGGVMLW